MRDNMETMQNGDDAKWRPCNIETYNMETCNMETYNMETSNFSKRQRRSARKY